METWSGSQLAISAETVAQTISRLAKIDALDPRVGHGLLIELAAMKFDDMFNWVNGFPSRPIMAKVSAIDKLFDKETD